MKQASIGVFLAGALTSTTAFAQSSVTLYGIADAGLEFTSHSTAGGNHGSTFSVVSGAAQTSRFGLRIREDLGNGYSALAVLENGFDATKGTANNSGRLFGRASYMGVQTPYGRLTMGRQTTGVYDFGLTFDAVGPALYSAVSFDAAFVGRADNSVEYKGDFNLLGGKLMVEQLYSFGYDGVTGSGTVAGAFRVGKEESFYTTYTHGAAMLGLMFDQQNGDSIASQDIKTQRYGVGGLLDFGSLQLYAAYRFYAQKQPGENLYSSLYWVAARYRVTPFFNVSTDLFYQADHNTGEGNPLMLSVLASYLLSKQTDVYLQIGTTLNKAHSNLGVTGFGTATTGSVQTGVIVGVRTHF